MIVDVRMLASCRNASRCFSPIHGHGHHCFQKPADLGSSLDPLTVINTQVVLYRLEPFRPRYCLNVLLTEPV